MQGLAPRLAPPPFRFLTANYWPRGGEDVTVKVWDAQTGQQALSLQGHTDRVTSVAFSPDGKRIVSGSLDQTVKVWDAQTRADPKSR